MIIVFYREVMTVALNDNVQYLKGVGPKRAEMLKKLEAEGDYTSRLALLEEYKTYPFAAVWDYYCLTNNVPVNFDYFAEIEKYENEVLLKR